MSQVPTKPALWPKAPFTPTFRPDAMHGPNTYPKQPGGKLSDTGALFLVNGRWMMLRPKGGEPSYELIPFTPDPRRNDLQVNADCFARYGAGWAKGQAFGAHDDLEGMYRRVNNLPHDAKLDLMTVRDLWYDRRGYNTLKAADIALQGGLPPTQPPVVPQPPPPVPPAQPPPPTPGTLTEPGQRVEELHAQFWPMVRPVLVAALIVFRKAVGK